MILTIKFSYIKKIIFIYSELHAGIFGHSQAPVRGFWLLWVTVLSPYFFQQTTPQEVDEKKQKKMERRMKRHQ